MIETILGKSIKLRKAKISDLESAYFNVWSDEELLKFTVWKKSNSLEEAKDRLKRNIEYQKENPYIYFITPVDSDEMIGFGGISEVFEGIYSEAGLCIARKYQGKGYGKELLDILLDLAFNTLNAKEFLYTFFKGNVVSRNLCFHYPFLYQSQRKIDEIEGRDLKELEVYSISKERYIKFKGNSMGLRLIKLTKDYQKELGEMIDEWKEDQEKNHTDRSPWAIFKNDYHDIDFYIENLDAVKDDKHVPSTTLFLLDEERNRLLGAVNIRHYLNERLLIDGGHIGDGIRPSERRKGYATKMIGLALLECKKLGIDKVLMTCNKDNIGSRKSIINNGGVLENEIECEGEIVQRYWIAI